MLSHCLGPLPHCIRQSRHLGRKLLSAMLMRSVLDFLLVPFPPDPAPGQRVQMPVLWHSRRHTAPVCLKICFFDTLCWYGLCSKKASTQVCSWTYQRSNVLVPQSCFHEIIDCRSLVVRRHAYVQGGFDWAVRQNTDHWTDHWRQDDGTADASQ